jgi:ABC-type uncharacterized transport system involved in gliding motility auxiliary subunit
MKINRQELIKTVGLLGPALLVAGYVSYSVQGTMGKLNLSLLIAGGVLTIAAVVLNFGAIRESSRRRSTRLGANTTVMSVAVIAIIGFANFLSYRHHKRFDLTAEKLYSLSDQTRKVVSDLNKDVKVILFDTADTQGLGDQMKEYRNLSSHFSFERIDPQENLEAARKYKITQLREVVVECGDRIERPKDTSEQTLVNTILKVTRERLKRIYFVEGHGEKRLAATNERDGYGVVDKMLKGENYEPKSFLLASTAEVPADCDVLVLAGPKQPLFEPEAAAIGKYLEKGGKAMLLIDPDTDPKLEEVLRVWGVKLGNDTVIDDSPIGQALGLGRGVPLVTDYGEHAITRDLKGITAFGLSRSVESESASGVSTTELIKTSDNSWGETELGEGKEPSRDPNKEKEGPLSLGVAASRSEGDKEGRLVVIGDSDFASNQFISGIPRNADLFMNCINWLAEDEDLISIRPKNPADRRVTMTEAQQSSFFWITLVFMPLAAIGTGFYIWWQRR